MLKRFRQMLMRQRNSTRESYAEARRQMVQRDLLARGINSQRVIEAISRVPRERFVDEQTRGQAYADRALQIACEQTISQPYIVALMTELLNVGPECRVLEIGTGSGYQTAILAELSRQVVTIERHKDLSQSAQRTLADLGYRNVEFVIGDGSVGWPERAPYERILVTAAAEMAPPSLIDQLADGGLLVAPIGPRSDQRLQLIRKENGVVEQTESAACRFVPLIGQQGFPLSNDPTRR